MSSQINRNKDMTDQHCCPLSECKTTLDQSNFSDTSLKENDRKRKCLTNGSIINDGGKNASAQVLFACNDDFESKPLVQKPKLEIKTLPTDDVPLLLDGSSLFENDSNHLTQNSTPTLDEIIIPIEGLSASVIGIVNLPEGTNISSEELDDQRLGSIIDSVISPTFSRNGINKSSLFSVSTNGDKNVNESNEFQQEKVAYIYLSEDNSIVKTNLNGIHVQSTNKVNDTFDYYIQCENTTAHTVNQTLRTNHQDNSTEEAEIQQNNEKKSKKNVVIKKQENVNIEIRRGKEDNFVISKQNKVQITTKPLIARFRNRKKVSAITLCAGCGQYCKIQDDDLVGTEKKNSETLAVETLLELQEVKPSSEEESIMLTKKGLEICDKAIQKQNINLMELLTSDNELVAFTGIDYDLLQRIAKLMALYEGATAKSYANSAKDRIILCLSKLRLNLSFKVLAFLFGMSHQVCASLFFTTIRTLSRMMEKVIHWPDTEELLKNLPRCFKNFKQTRLMLNSSEMQIEKQRCTKCQLKLDANNKGYESVKLILGVAPNGLIIFKSNVFDAQAEETSVFSKTNILNKLNPFRDAIMTDKSLNIEEECTTFSITLIKPPKLEKNKELNVNDVELAKNISTARVHIDRTVQRFKMYKIVQQKVSWRIIPCLDDVCTVIAGIINLKNPVPPDESRFHLSGFTYK